MKQVVVTVVAVVVVAVEAIAIKKKKFLLWNSEMDTLMLFEVIIDLLLFESLTRNNLL